MNRSEATKLAWQNPEYRLKHIKGLKKSWEDPSTKIKHSISSRIGAKNRWSDDNERKKCSDRAKEFWKNNPEMRKNLSDTVKKTWKDPSVREKMLNALDKNRKKGWDSIDRRIEASTRAKKMWENEDRRLKVSKLNKEIWERDKSLKIKLQTRLFKTGILLRNSSKRKRKMFNKVNYYYLLSNQINYDYIDQYITDAEIFIKYFSATK